MSRTSPPRSSQSWRWAPAAARRAMMARQELAMPLSRSSRAGPTTSTAKPGKRGPVSPTTMAPPRPCVPGKGPRSPAFRLHRLSGRDDHQQHSGRTGGWPSCPHQSGNGRPARRAGGLLPQRSRCRRDRRRDLVAVRTDDDDRRRKRGWDQLLAHRYAGSGYHQGATVHRARPRMNLAGSRARR